MNQQGRSGGGRRRLIAVAVVLGGVGFGAGTAVHRGAPAAVVAGAPGGHDIRPVIGDRWYEDPPDAAAGAVPGGDRWYADPGA